MYMSTLIVNKDRKLEIHRNRKYIVDSVSSFQKKERKILCAEIDTVTIIF